MRGSLPPEADPPLCDEWSSDTSTRAALDLVHAATARFGEEQRSRRPKACREALASRRIAGCRLPSTRSRTARNRCGRTWLGLTGCDKPPERSPSDQGPPASGGRSRGTRSTRARARLRRSRPRRPPRRLAGREASCGRSVNASKRDSTASPCRCSGFSRTRDRSPRSTRGGAHRALSEPDAVRCSGRRSGTRGGSGRARRESGASAP